MSGDRPLVQVGDLLELHEGDYMHGSGPYQYGEDGLRLRVKHVTGAALLDASEWVPMIGIEVLPSGVDGPERVVIARRSALPGYRGTAV